jgi:hypothetical protein
MSYESIVDAYATILCPTLELDGLGYTVLDEWFILSPLGKLVNGHVDVLETTLSSLERSH